MAITITTISIQKENLTMKWDLLEDDMDDEKSVSCEDVLLGAFELISYFFSQNALIQAYYNLDPDTLSRRSKSDPVRKYMPGFGKSGE